MNNIKFRVFDKVKKEWLLGYELPNLGGFSMIGEMMMMGEWAGVLSEYFPDRLGDLDIMRFTGLKDKEGKEIYEGDVVEFYFSIDDINKDREPITSTVTFEDGCFIAMKSNTTVLLLKDVANFATNYQKGGIKVIGNLYENRL